MYQGATGTELRPLYFNNFQSTIYSKLIKVDNIFFLSYWTSGNFGWNKFILSLVSQLIYSPNQPIYILGFWAVYYGLIFVKLKYKE